MAEGVLNPEQVFLYLIDKETNELVNTAPEEHDGSYSHERIKMGEGVEGFVAESGDMYQTDDTKSCTTFAEITKEQVRHPGPRERSERQNGLELRALEVG